MSNLLARCLLGRSGICHCSVHKRITHRRQCLPFPAAPVSCSAAAPPKDPMNPPNFVTVLDFLSHPFHLGLMFLKLTREKWVVLVDTMR